MDKPKRPLITKTIIINENDEYLVLRRDLKDDVGAGKLDLPGGGVDEHEGIYEGAVREVFEETGITLSIEDIELVCTKSKFQPTNQGKKNLHRFLFVARVHNAPVAVSEEHDAHYWFTKRELLANYDHHAWRPMLDYYFKYY